MNKKVKFFMALMNFLIVVTLTSCNNAIENESLIVLMNAKWEISDPNSDYSSFEFNRDGNFIVVEDRTNPTFRAGLSKEKSSFQQNSSRIGTRASSDSKFSPVHFGDFQINGNTINLSDFGTITVASITADEFSFSFTIESTGKIQTFTANKVKESISASKRTEIFCRTWIIHKVTIDEATLSETDKNWYVYQYGSEWKVEAEKELIGSIVLFTKAGTYLVSYADEELSPGLFWWKWGNEEESVIHFSENNWQNNWTEYGFSAIELSNTTLKMTDNGRYYELKLTK